MFVVLALVVADPFIEATALTSGRLTTLLLFVGAMLGVDMVANRLQNSSVVSSEEGND